MYIYIPYRHISQPSCKLTQIATMWASVPRIYHHYISPQLQVFDYVLSQLLENNNSTSIGLYSNYCCTIGLYPNNSTILIIPQLSYPTMAVPFLSTPWQPRSYRIVGYRDIPPQKKLLPGTEERTGPGTSPICLSYFMIVHHDFSQFIIVYYQLSWLMMAYRFSLYFGLSSFFMVYHGLSLNIMGVHGLSCLFL